MSTAGPDRKGKPEGPCGLLRRNSVQSRTMTTTSACRGCGQPADPGRAWHKPCLDAYRRSTDYRAQTLARDGYACARCFAAWNRTVLATLGALHLTRRVDVDHVDPIGGTGTQQPHNWQVLCKRHHRSKTRVDLARLKGQRVPMSRARKAQLATVAVAVLASATLADRLRQAGIDPTARATQVAFVLAVAVVLAVTLTIRARRRAVERLHSALAPVLGASVTARKPIRVRRWRLVRRRWTPVDFTVRYPHTFADSDSEQQTAVEQRVAAKLGLTWAPTWQTTDDRVRFTSPDPLAVAGSTTWPGLHAPRCNLWEPIEVGIDERGEPVRLGLVERNLLIGGEPGGGKSVSMSIPLAAAALDPDCTLHLIDGKRVEQAVWRDVVEGQIVFSHDDAITMLAELQAQMDLRYELLADERRRKVTQGDGLGLHVLGIDELALFTAGGSKSQRDRFTELLRDFISRGRAAGMITIGATQRPSADVIPTNVRDLIGLRWALRCTTPSSSDMVLGQGWASQGYSAAKVDPQMRGVGWLLAEGGRPRRLKSHLLTDDDLERIAQRAVDLRRPPVRPVSLVKP